MARMPWRDACRLDNSLASLDHFFKSPPDYAQTLSGGLTNRCWKVVLTNGECYVWRPNSQMLQAFSISRYQEHRILSSINSANLSPKAYLVNANGLLVEWLEEEPQESELSFDTVIELFTKVHQLDISSLAIAPFNYTARVDHYWIQIDENLKPSELVELYQQWRTAPTIPEVQATLCHFDLGAYNVVHTEDGYKVIDWEYASLADPRLDLTLAIIGSEQPVTESVRQYCLMRNVEGVDDWVEGVVQWQPRAMLMAMLWYLLAHQLKGGENYLESAQALQKALTTEKVEY